MVRWPGEGGRDAVYGADGHHAVRIHGILQFVLRGVVFGRARPDAEKVRADAGGGGGRRAERRPLLRARQGTEPAGREQDQSRAAQVDPRGGAGRGGRGWAALRPARGGRERTAHVDLGVHQHQERGRRACLAGQAEPRKPGITEAAAASLAACRSFPRTGGHGRHYTRQVAGNNRHSAARWTGPRAQGGVGAEAAVREGLN
mmetsp:Transcript_18482/g.39161  ORF Transcript_18482/g.39161 Transcript_18482/m.39161 type:complete len:202 (-) Transcript_18482:750-1355(-)